MNRIFIPAPKSLLKVEEDWTFPLYAVASNYKLLSQIAKNKNSGLQTLRLIKYLCAEDFITLEKGSLISLETYLLKQQMEKSNGITFQAVQTNCKEFYPKGKFFKYRFFAKWCDIKRANLSLVKKDEKEILSLDDFIEV